MTYLTLEDIKYQLRIDADFTEDDTLLETLGDAAENFLESHLNCALDDIVAENSGEFPKALYQALLIFVSYSYDNDGSGEPGSCSSRWYRLWSRNPRPPRCLPPNLHRCDTAHRSRGNCPR